MKTDIKICGDDYQVISTELARKAIEGEMSLHEAEEGVEPMPNGDPIWWEVVSDIKGMVLWMNNMDGDIILLSPMDKSYYRVF